CVPTRSMGTRKDSSGSHALRGSPCWYRCIPTRSVGTRNAERWNNWLPHSAWQPLLVPLHSRAEHGNEEIAFHHLAPTLCVVALAGTVVFPHGAWERGKIFRREYRQFTAVTQVQPAYSQVAA